MWQDVIAALCLAMVLEGILPFAAPKAWRETMIAAIQLDNRKLRLLGLSSMLIGTSLLYFIKQT